MSMFDPSLEDDLFDLLRHWGIQEETEPVMEFLRERGSIGEEND